MAVKANITASNFTLSTEVHDSIRGLASTCLVVNLLAIVGMLSYAQMTQVASHESTPHGKALNSSKLLARVKYFGSIFTEFAFARGMQNIMYSKPNLIALPSLSNFAFDGYTSKCSLNTTRNVEKYILINQLSTAGGRWVDPTHFMPVIRQNSLMENLPRSSPTSNHRVSPIP
ncbi:hypothetical protein TIFTF001_017035 [Ficus carica]|uniref:Uncharacterized protein n=1 Tax=Ficus carica TaxID=3494 RepID=A0AA88D6Q5_FICCA|nr:hypothetical protein TIFTF001_017035 [Ficus carica]